MQRGDLEQTRAPNGNYQADWRKPKARRWSSQLPGPFPSISASLSPLGCRPSRIASTMWGRQAGERQEPADVGVCDALLLRKVGDRLGLPALDPPPPAVCTDGMG